MSLLLRTTALMLLVLSRAPAFAAVQAMSSPPEENRGQSQNQSCPKMFRHSLSGLYHIPSTGFTAFQPYSDFDVLYTKAHQAQYELETVCKSTALLTDTQAHFSGIKSRERALEKVSKELNGDVSRITDLARATIIANDIPSLVNAYEALAREANIIKVKNRFKSPAESGYRDLNVLIQLPKTKLIAEVQFHLRAIEEVKSGAEHALYEQIQLLERNAAQEARSLNEFEVAQIHHLRSQSKELYHQAWLPYITTHTQAA